LAAICGHIPGDFVHETQPIDSVLLLLLSWQNRCWDFVTNVGCALIWPSSLIRPIYHHTNYFSASLYSKASAVSFRHLLAKQNRSLSPWHNALSDFPPRARFPFSYFRSYPSLKTPQHGVVLCCIPPLMSHESIILWWQRVFLNYFILSRDDALPHHLLPAWYYTHKYIRMYIHTCPRALMNATSRH